MRRTHERGEPLSPSAGSTLARSAGRPGRAAAGTIGRLLGHRGPLHSALAALVAGVPDGLLGERFGVGGLGVLVGHGWVAHFLADAMTDRGVLLKWPLWRLRKGLQVYAGGSGGAAVAVTAVLSPPPHRPRLVEWRPMRTDSRLRSVRLGRVVARGSSTPSTRPARRWRGAPGWPRRGALALPVVALVAACAQGGAAQGTRPGTASPAPSGATPPVAGPAPVATGIAPVPVAGARLYALPGERAYPEGLAYDAAGRHFYTGSLTDGALFRGSPDTGAVTVFSPARADGRATVLGIEVDAARRRLWVAGGAAQRLYAYDLDTARLVRQWAVPSGAPGAPAALLNGVALTPAGDAYVTDSQRPVLWRVGAGGPDGPGELEAWLDLAAGPVPWRPSANLNGIVATPDGAALLTVHSRTGRLFRVGVASGAVQEVELDAPVPGGDGLALDGTTLLAVAAGQIVRLDLTPDYARGTRRDAFTHPALALPTAVQKVGDRLLVTNSQVDTLAAGRPTLPFTVADIPLPG